MVNVKGMRGELRVSFVLFVNKKGRNLGAFVMSIGMLFIGLEVFEDMLFLTNLLFVKGVVVVLDLMGI